jgi:hypothetical protein
VPWFRYYWSEEPNGNIQKVAEHGLTTDDFEFAFENFDTEANSRSSHRLIRFCSTPDGRRIAVVFEWDEIDVTVIPVTAYEV